MLKTIKLKNSTIILIGIIIIVIGISLGFYEYFLERKNNAFSEMNILLYENEIPENIESENEVQNENKDESEMPEETDNQNQTQSYNYKGILEIPKISLKHGFYDLNNKKNNVDYNVTVIKGSTFPDIENNNLILAAHSGPCSYCYFDNLYKLSLNDVAYVYYSGIKYYYKIVNIYEVEKDGTVAIYRDYSKNTLTLITCTRNSNTKQTVYILELYNQQKY